MTPRPACPPEREARRRDFGVARWAGLAFVVVWAPLYWREYGLRNFFQLCDIAVFVTVLGLWTRSALLLSSQAVAVLVVDALWAIDVLSRLAFGFHPIGGTEYMWQASIPWYVRGISLFHVAWPPLCLWAVRATGYDRRGWLLQSALAAAMIAASHLFTDAAYNVNFAHRAPFLVKGPMGPPAAHVALSALAIIVLVYLPTHLLLRRLFRPPGPA